MRILALQVLVVAALAALAACARIAGDDEVPIIVRNGSMDIESSGKFKEAGDAGNEYEHESPDTRHKHKGDFWVKISTRSPVTGCTETSKGKRVEIEYSDKFVATFKITGSKTRIGPKTSLNKVSDSKLRYSPDGYIAAVRVDSTQVCTLTSADQLREIAICSGSATDQCK